MEFRTLGPELRSGATVLSRKTTVLPPETSPETLPPSLPPAWERARRAGCQAKRGDRRPAGGPLGARSPRSRAPRPPAPPLRTTRAPSAPARRLPGPEPHGLPGGSPSQPQDTARAGRRVGGSVTGARDPFAPTTSPSQGKGGGGAAPGDDVTGARPPGGAGRGGKCDVDAGRRGLAAASRGAAGPRAESRPGVPAGALEGTSESGFRGGRLPGPRGLESGPARAPRLPAVPPAAPSFRKASPHVTLQSLL